MCEARSVGENTLKSQARRLLEKVGAANLHEAGVKILGAAGGKSKGGKGRRGR